MAFEKFEGPWNDAEFLGCRNLFCGDRLILDLFEYLQTGPDENVKIGSETISGTHTIGLTASSRIWRLTLDTAQIALREVDQKMRCKLSIGMGAILPCKELGPCCGF